MCTADACCQGRKPCPTPEACHLPIQPSAEEIRRDRLDLWKSRLSYAAVIGGMCTATAVVAFVIGRIAG